MIPPLSDEEFKQLEENILQDGIRDPLVLWGDILVDGHNRYKIAQKHGLQFSTVQKEFESRDDAIIWMIDTQCGKRNLPDYAKVKLNLRKESILSAKARERMVSGKHNPSPTLGKGRVDTQIGNMSGVGRESVRKVKFVEKNGTEEIKEKASSGEISINEAFRRTIPKTPDKKAEVRTAIKEHETFKQAVADGDVVSISDISADKANQSKIAEDFLNEISKARSTVFYISSLRSDSDLVTAITAMSEKQRDTAISFLNDISISANNTILKIRGVMNGKQ